MKIFKYIGRTRTAVLRKIIYPGQLTSIPKESEDQHITSLIKQGLLVPIDNQEDDDQNEDNQDDEALDLESMTKADLIAHALTLEIAADNRMTKKEIIELIKSNK